mmetsp:Transcript_10092/g.31829  ORF Transcript_10092/g.31829 Transcript_10092/m.31829 type:complete len:215 (+) Transcript_10092:210-854(+)
MRGHLQRPLRGRLVQDHDRIRPGADQLCAGADVQLRDGARILRAGQRPALHRAAPHPPRPRPCRAAGRVQRRRAGPEGLQRLRIQDRARHQLAHAHRPLPVRIHPRAGPRARPRLLHQRAWHARVRGRARRPRRVGLGHARLLGRAGQAGAGAAAQRLHAQPRHCVWPHCVRHAGRPAGHLRAGHAHRRRSPEHARHAQDSRQGRCGCHHSEGP